MNKTTFRFRLLRFFACVLLFGIIAAQRGGKAFGFALHRENKTPSVAESVPSPIAVENTDTVSPSAETESGTIPAEAVQTEPDGSMAIDSTTLAPNIRGYAGPVPVRVRIGPDGLVAAVEPLPNEESPGFFKKLTRAGLWQSWDGLPVAEAAEKPVDAITGATFSSQAAIENVRAALRAVPDSASAEEEQVPDPTSEMVPDSASAPVSVTTIAAVFVLLVAAIAPLVSHARTLRTVRLVLNVIVLGFGSGLFLSHARLVGWAGSGLPRDVWSLAGAILLLVTAFLFPLFGKPGHYCAHVCPFGSLQELAGRIPARKWSLSPALARGLNIARRVVWVALLAALVLGRAGSALDWELFAAFAWRAVPPLVLALAIASVALSVFVPRAYCRFVCPTGSLFKFVDSGR